MRGINLSPTAQEILALYFVQPGKKFYVNELIRLTGRYPNSVQVALKTLEKQKILISSKKGRLKLHELNQKHPFLSEIRRMIDKQRGLVPKRTGDYDWVKILNRQTSYSFTAALCKSNIDNLDEIYGFSIPNFWHNSITFGVYYLQKDLVDLGSVISKKIEADPSFAKKDIASCQRACNGLVKKAKKIPALDLARRSNPKLAVDLKEFYDAYLAVFPFVTVPHAVERHFESKIRKTVGDESVLEVILSPASFYEEEQHRALAIAAYAKKNGFDKKFNQLLTRHWDDYCWLTLWSIHSQPLTREYFEDEIKNILQKVDNPKKEIKRLKVEEGKGKKRLESTLKRIKASRALTDQVYLLQKYIFLRTFRKNAICQAHYYYLPLLFESGRRLELTEKEVKFLSLKEIVQGLTGRVSKKKLVLQVAERQKGWAILLWKGKIKTITEVKNVIETMEQYRIIAPSAAMQRVVKGNPACRGRATGRVKIVRKLSELNKVEKGDVLVAKMTTPDYMIAIHKAAAIVTDEGGVTCHAAIVSREFNLPCIVGTKNATQILSDNDLIEVDANEGVVRVVEAVEIDEDVKQIYGKTAYKGKVRGSVRIVLDANDFPKVKEGDILVAPQTTPEYLSSLYKVKGFIVDEESITSHAMFYAKALKLPALIGTQFARHVLQDGERVELDASRGLVKRLS